MERKTNTLSKRILSMMLATLMILGIFVSTGMFTVAAAQTVEVRVNRTDTYTTPLSGSTSVTAYENAYSPYFGSAKGDVHYGNVEVYSGNNDSTWNSDDKNKVSANGKSGYVVFDTPAKNKPNIYTVNTKGNELPTTRITGAVAYFATIGKNYTYPYLYLEVFEDVTFAFRWQGQSSDADIIISGKGIYQIPTLNGTSGGFNDYWIGYGYYNNAPPLTIAKTVNGEKSATVTVGDTVEYKIEITNSYPLASIDTTVTDEMFSEAVASSIMVNNQAATVIDNTIAVTVPANGTVTITYSVEFDAAGTYPNIAALNITDKAEDTYEDSATVVVVVNEVSNEVFEPLEVTKAANTELVTNGSGDVTYTITIENKNDVAVENVILSDTKYGFETTGNFTIDTTYYTVLDGTLLVTVPARTATAPGTVIVKYTVTLTNDGVERPDAVNVDKQVDNTAAISYTVPDGWELPEGETPFDSDDETVTVEPTDANVTVTKTAVNEKIKSGQTAAFKIEVTNSGNKAAQVNLSDSIDPNEKLYFISATSDKYPLLTIRRNAKILLDLNKASHTAEFTIYGQETITIMCTTAPLMNTYNPLGDVIAPTPEEVEAIADAEEVLETAEEALEVAKKASEDAESNYYKAMADYAEAKLAYDNAWDQYNTDYAAYLIDLDAWNIANDAYDPTDSESVPAGEMPTEPTKPTVDEPGDEPTDDTIALYKEYIDAQQAVIDATSVLETLNAQDVSRTEGEQGEDKRYTNTATVNGQESEATVEVEPTALGVATIVKEVKDPETKEWVKSIAVDADVTSADFRLTITNHGDIPAIVNLKDEFDDVSTDIPGTLMGIVTVPANDSVELYYTASFDENDTSDIKILNNIATITGVLTDGGNTEDSSNAVVIQKPKPKAAIYVEKTLVDEEGNPTTDSVAHGDPAYFAITITNYGNAPAIVNVEDIFNGDDGYEIIGLPPSSITVGHDTDPTVILVSVVVTNTGIAPITLKNHVKISTDGDAKIIKGEDDAYVTVDPQPYVRLSVIKEVAQYDDTLDYGEYSFVSNDNESPLAIANGSQALYKITIYNTGTAAAEVEVEETFEAGELTLVGGDVSGGISDGGIVVLYYLSGTLTNTSTTESRQVRNVVTVLATNLDGEVTINDHSNEENLTDDAYVAIPPVDPEEETTTTAPTTTAATTTTSTPPSTGPEDTTSGDDEPTTTASGSIEPYYSPLEIPVSAAYEANTDGPPATNAPEPVIESAEDPVISEPEEDIPEEDVALAEPDLPDNTATPETEAKKVMAELEEEFKEEDIPLDAPDLPKTGGLSGIMAALAGLGLLGAGTVLNKKKKDDDNQ